MRQTPWGLLQVLALAVCAATACSSGAPGSTNTPDSGSLEPSVPGAVTNNDNTRFVIPPTSNGNTTAAPAGITVTNFTPADAVTFQFGVNNGIAGINAAIVLNSTPSACNDANANNFHVGETQIVINLTDIPDSQIATNTYVFPAAANAPYEIASATYAVVQSPCYYNSVSLVSGQVVLSDVESDSMSGTYTLQFATGTVSGSFNTAANCAAVGETPATAPTCN